MMLRIILFFMLLSPIMLRAQFYSDQLIHQDSISDWNQKEIKSYFGIYAFGYSEGEYSVRVYGDDTLQIAQIHKYTWNEEGWVDTFILLSNVRIEGNKFYADETNGKFVRFKFEGNKEKALLLEDPFGYAFHEGGELGSRWDASLDGKYLLASVRPLSLEELKQFTNEELSIMRNEIFARYGYKFREGGKMWKYFSQFDWYRPTYQDVDLFLTEIEKINIDRIRQIENSRK
ncbi:MAG: YARHG domain-containing protein [Brumimicrobium sp.]|nr:YARHG domain-containing protein [Brumimicrobium sp.]